MKAKQQVDEPQCLRCRVCSYKAEDQHFDTEIEKNTNSIYKTYIICPVCKSDAIEFCDEGEDAEK